MEIGRGEIDDNLFIGEGESGANQGAFDSFFGFVDGFIGHADDVEGGKTSVGAAFYFYEFTIVAIGDGRIYFCNHGFI